MSSTKSYRTPEVLEIDLSENSYDHKSNSTAYTSSSSGKSSHKNYNKSDKSYNKSEHNKSTKSTKSTKSSRSPKPSKSTKSSKPSKSTKSSSTPSIKTIDLNDDVGPSRPRYTQPPPHHAHTHSNSHTPHSHTKEDNRPGIYQGGVELGVCNGCAKEESPLRKVSREYLCGECRQSPQFKLITKSTVLKRYPNLDFHDLIDGYQDRTLRCFFVPNWIDPSSHSIKLYYEHEIAALANSK